MMKVFLCGHPLFHYLDSIADGFRQNGCDVHVFTHKNTNVLKLQRKNFLKRFRSKLELEKINRQLLDEVNEFKPDLFLAINGEVILDKTLNELKQSCKTAIWLVDGVDNIKLQRETMNSFDSRFVFEPADTKSLKDATYLPYGCDFSIYNKADVDYERDVAFVGSGHEDRLELLNKLAVFCKQIGISFEIFGPFNKKYKEHYPDLFDSIKLNGKVMPEQVAEIYRSTKINLNIHHRQSKDGVNPRVFEVSGCGAFQLCDYKPYISKFFPDGEVSTYENFDNLIKIVEKYVINDSLRKQSALSAMKIVEDSHTFKERAAVILNMV